MWTIYEHKSAIKGLKALPIDILKRYEKWKDIKDCPESIVKRLKHYFLTYKGIPGENSPKVEITHIYGKEEALEVINRSKEDYLTHFGDIGEELSRGIQDVIGLKESY